MKRHNRQDNLAYDFTMICRRIFWLAIVEVFGLPAAAYHAAQTYDVVVYGATAGGAIAAIAAANEGVRVALVDPGRHVGGMVSGGLSKSDVDRQENLIGGLAREFFVRVGKYYHQPVAWSFEPHVAKRCSAIGWKRTSSRASRKSANRGPELSACARTAVWNLSRPSLSIAPTKAT